MINFNFERCLIKLERRKRKRKGKGKRKFTSMVISTIPAALT